ncbi:MAG: formyl transferase [Rhodospirillaceae bacterium]|nr:MAG: formyl transferase [Rhodospirillaceae bacterium]
MRVAVLGRTRLLLDTARALLNERHRLCLIGTCRADPSYDVREDDFHALAKEHGADFFNDSRINRPEIVSRLEKAKADVTVSINWLTLIGPAPIAAFPYGILNAHAGDLPRYRGNACPNWAILNGEPYVGVCIHAMEANSLDSGPVFLRRRFPLSTSTYIGDISAWLADTVPAMFVEVLGQLARGTAHPEPQPRDPALTLHCYPRRPADSRIDWGTPASRISALVRASSRPFDGAYTTLEGNAKVTVWRARIEEHPGPFLAVPGQVLYGSDGDPVIATGEGVLQLEDVALERTSSGTEAKAAILRSLRQRLI